MRLRTGVAGVGVLAGIVAAGCSGKEAPPPVCSAPQGAASSAQSLATNDASFAAAFYGPAVAASGTGQNAIFSPYSISATLMMVDVGAAGQTDTQMQSVLELPANAGSLAPAYAALACGDETDGNAKGDQLSIANSLWGQSGVAFESAFTSTLASGYDAPLQQVDFQDDPSAAASTINAWVSDQTEGLIPTLLQGSDVDSTTRLVLVDAIYFKGTWAIGFDPSATQPGAFTRSDGSSEQVPTMNGTVNLAPGDDRAGFTPYELPYKGGGLAMDFLLPDATSSLAALESSLTAQSLAAALASIGPSEQVQLFLPKFSFSTRLELVPILQGMGMTDVFEPQVANLSGMDGAMDLYVGAVVHQALVEVDESGTVAAAATSASGDDAFSVSEPPEVQIDRPFLFLIRDVGSGSILFMGRVEDPAQ